MKAGWKSRGSRKKAARSAFTLKRRRAGKEVRYEKG
jgi:hypothetical protein